MWLTHGERNYLRNVKQKLELTVVGGQRIETQCVKCFVILVEERSEAKSKVSKTNEKMSGIEVFQDPLQVLPSDFNNLIGIESEQEHTEANIGDEFYGQVGGNDGNVGAAVGQHNPAVLVEPVSEYPPYEIFQGQDEVHEVNFQVQQPDNGGHQEVDQALSANEVERPASVTNPFSETFLEDFPPKFIKGAFVGKCQNYPCRLSFALSKNTFRKRPDRRKAGRDFGDPGGLGALHGQVRDRARPR